MTFYAPVAPGRHVLSVLHHIREGTGCAIWFGDLVDIKQFSTGGQDLYIRMHPLKLGMILIL